VSRVKAFLRTKWFLQGIGIVALVMLIWFLGPLIAIAEVYILELAERRLILILLLVSIWIGWRVFRQQQAKSTNAELLKEMALEAEEPGERDSSAIQAQFQQAIEILKSSSGKRRGDAYLYELPWYIIIGPPGSGKTVALLNSGLHFPLEDRFGLEKIKGIGGTRDCDWWFTQEAVLIDTAGRFTTQDSDAQGDKVAWANFMNMLKKYRRQRPINGVLLAYSIEDLQRNSEQENHDQARTIRHRLDELSKHLDIRFPVYFMFTKCDLLYGFNAFFGRLNESERNQVWGHTYHVSDADQAFEPNAFVAHFDGLVNRLKQQLITRVDDEKLLEKRTAIAGFPSQIAAMREKMVGFMDDIFSENRFQTSAWLRGVYFTSGTQLGTPFDQIAHDMAQRMGMEQTIRLDAEPDKSGTGRSYFLQDLLSNVVFAEAGLAGTNLKFQRMLKAAQYASIVTAVLLLIAFTAVWSISFNENRDRIAQVNSRLSDADNLAYKRPAMQGAQFKNVLPELNSVRDMPSVFEEKTWLTPLGLDQKKVFDKPLKGLYQSALNNKLLPLIVSRIEVLIWEKVAAKESEGLYDLLKAYLMYGKLHDAAGVDFEPEWLNSLMAEQWQQLYGYEPEMVTQLLAHHRSLLNGYFEPARLDQKVVSAARAVLLSRPLSQQIYQNVKQSLLQQHQFDLSLADIAGNKGHEVFASRGKRSFTETVIPSLYTNSGFYQLFINTTDNSITDFLNKDWVLGEHNGGKSVAKMDEAELKREVFNSYYADYIKTWSAFLNDLAIRDPADSPVGPLLFETLFSVNGPLDQLVRVVSEETNLAVVAVANGVDSQAVVEVAGLVNGSAGRALSNANQIANKGSKAGLSVSLGDVVTKQFSAFHRLVKEGRAEPMIYRLQDNGQKFSGQISQILNNQFNDVAGFTAVENRIKSQGVDPFTSLHATDAYLPKQLKAWIDTVDNAAWRLLLTKAKQEVSAIWQRDVYEFYQSALAGRYPLDPTQKTEVELQDFATFFKPNGVLDNFIANYLDIFIQRRHSMWQRKALDKQGQQIDITPDTVNAIRLGALITELFFRKGGSQPSIDFVLSPLSLDTNVASFNLSMGNQKLSHFHGPPESTKFSWPLQAGNDLSSFLFKDKAEQPISASQSGPWSVFRLLDSQQLTPSDQRSVFKVTFTGTHADKAYTAVFELRVNTEFNPLGERLLQQFSLPTEL